MYLTILNYNIFCEIMQIYNFWFFIFRLVTLLIWLHGLSLDKFINYPLYVLS